METGQKIIQQKTNIDELSSNILSIQVSLNGLSFCILNTDDNSISTFISEEFKKRVNPSELLDQIKAYFNSDSDLQGPFKAVNLIYDNELSTIVPKSLFDENHLADYLKFNSRILQNDVMTYDSVDVNDSVVVYVPYMNINNYLYGRFGAFEYRHFSSVLLDAILSLEKHTASEKMYIHVGNQHFEILVIDKNGLRLYNTFEYQTKEDFIYYILFTAEQLELNPEEFELIALGQIKEDDDLYKMAYTYVRHISIYSADYNFTLDESLSKNILQNFVLLNSF